MKARHLEILKEQGFPVPRFILVSENEEVDLSFSERECFAVRSNFSSEDSGEHSFAGQFLTRLNVKREKVEEAVEAVFASYAGSLDYKEKANRGKAEYDLKQQGKAETVLIQEMLFPEKSGVLFTKNPKGILSEMVVVLGQGLGDKVVEDQEKVLTYHYFPGECLYQEGQGTGIGLEEDELKTLFSLGDEIEQLFQKPMDIEFAIEKGKIYILQARAITTLD
ncbi:MAG: phosphoenolpyruvate synthase, partial [Oribacterium parvum]|nr:phosphoenolpyruvate synthase [Oribacterium parvum]